MAEYLASHGYIVASVALAGESSQQLDFEISEYETSADDISFAISSMQSFPNVDRGKLGLIGFCRGSMINALIANRNSNVDLMIDLFGAFNTKEVRDEIGAERFHFLKNPSLAYMQLAGSVEERDSYFFDNFLYCDAYQARFNNVSHGSFTSNYVIRNHYFKGKLPNGKDNTYADTVDACYKNVCRLSLEMANAYLKKNEASLKHLNSSANGLSNVEYRIRKASEIPPSPVQFIRIARTEGVLKAKQIYDVVRSKDKYWKLFKENQMIAIGYQFIASNKVDDAIELFSLLLLDFPNSWNGYDSLGEAWFKKGDKEQAKKFLEKSIKLFPDNQHAIELLKQL
jgi:tetratricopeptide (TPR) repeat protein